MPKRDKAHEKDLNEILLYDFYGELLTRLQREIFELYYHEDLSLFEISEQYAISRQSVSDSLKRTRASLHRYETRLRLLEGHRERLRRNEELVERLTALANERVPLTDSELAQIRERLLG